MSWLRLLSVLSVLTFAAPAFAEDAAESRSAAFQAMDGARGEQVPGGPLLVSAYAVVMVLVVGYVARLGMMQRKTAADVERLSTLIQRARPQGK